ncbi:hypothetical protein J2S19_000938 [Metabacillus malikii]|uniref:Uncharacterized protein n=1 Tax=Metabacillus malikii TaxID=1504265 RepID=A0ABT9ZCZ3_9BACI|nr:hypothetical protein [Metabacillus malikii]
MPYEARQPSVSAEMVPIHTKRIALKDGRKDKVIVPFCSHAERLFVLLVYYYLDNNIGSR